MKPLNRRKNPNTNPFLPKGYKIQYRTRLSQQHRRTSSSISHPLNQRGFPSLIKLSIPLMHKNSQLNNRRSAPRFTSLDPFCKKLHHILNNDKLKKKSFAGSTRVSNREEKKPLKQSIKLARYAKAHRSTRIQRLSQRAFYQNSCSPSQFNNSKIKERRHQVSLLNHTVINLDVIEVDKLRKTLQKSCKKWTLKSLRKHLKTVKLQREKKDNLERNEIQKNYSFLNHSSAYTINNLGKEKSSKKDKKVIESNSNPKETLKRIESHYKKYKNCEKTITENYSDFILVLQLQFNNVIDGIDLSILLRLITTFLKEGFESDISFLYTVLEFLQESIPLVISLVNIETSNSQIQNDRDKDVVKNLVEIIGQRINEYVVLTDANVLVKISEFYYTLIERDATQNSGFEEIQQKIEEDFSKFQFMMLKLFSEHLKFSKITNDSDKIILNPSKDKGHHIRNKVFNHAGIKIVFKLLSPDILVQVLDVLINKWNTDYEIEGSSLKVMIVLFKNVFELSNQSTFSTIKKYCRQAEPKLGFYVIFDQMIKLITNYSQPQNISQHFGGEFQTCLVEIHKMLLGSAIDEMTRLDIELSIAVQLSHLCFQILFGEGIKNVSIEGLKLAETITDIIGFVINCQSKVGITRAYMRKIGPRINAIVKRLKVKNGNLVNKGKEMDQWCQRVCRIKIKMIDILNN